MTEGKDIDALRYRVAALEAENESLRESSGQDPPATPSRAIGTLRSGVAVLLIALSVILAPVAAVGTWARGQLVDTDRFVETFAPLAHDPQFQAFVAAQVTDAIEARVDIDGIVDDLVTGLSQLDLSPRARAAVGLLAAPTAEGVRSLIRSGVERTVASDGFEQMWEVSLRQTHERATGILQGDPDRALQLSDDGTLSLQLGPVVSEVRELLVRQGFVFADRIPEIERSIPVVASDSLTLVRMIYQVSSVAGYWLPWCVLALLVAGVALARNRLRALAWAGAGLTAAFLLLGGGIGVGRRFFVTSVSPSVMPSAAADALYDQITVLISAAISALVVLAALIAVGAWLYGTSRGAVAIRTAGDRAFGALRNAADRNGVGTGAFGRTVERWRPAILLATVALGMVAVFLNRPASMSGVITTLVIVLLVVLVVELVRRPGAAPEPPEAPASGT